MKEEILTDEQWFQMYTDVSSHQFGEFAPNEEILELTDEVTEIVDNTQLISNMIAETLEEIEITPLGDFDNVPLELDQTETPKKELYVGKTQMYLRCTNDNCTSTARLINFAAGCKLPRDCSVCGSTLKLGKE